MNTKFSLNFVGIVSLPLSLLYAITPFYLFSASDLVSALGGALAFCLMLYITLRLSGMSEANSPHTTTLLWEFIFLFAAAFYFLYPNRLSIDFFTSTRIRSDMATTTELAAQMFWRQGLNPYTQIVAPSTILTTMQGFHYGPTTFLLYFLCAFIPITGLTMTNLFFVLVSLISVFYLGSFQLSDGKKDWIGGLGAAIFLLVIPQFLYESFARAAPDIFPTALLLLALIGIKNKSWLFVGLMIGSAISAKWSPGAFMAVLLLRKDLPFRYWLGLGIGLVPIIFCLAWDHQAFIENSLIMHILKPPDPTSLRPLIIPQLQWIFKIIPIVVLFSVWNTFRRSPLTIQEIVPRFLTILVVFEICFTEIHANHLVWFAPFYTLVIAWNRRASGRVLVEALGFG